MGRLDLGVWEKTQKSLSTRFSFTMLGFVKKLLGGGGPKVQGTAPEAFGAPTPFLLLARIT